MPLLSHVDDGICLDIVHVGVTDAQLLPIPLRRADDPRGDGVLQGEGAADGNNKLTRAQVWGETQQQHWQLFLRESEREREREGERHTGQ